MPIEVAIVDDDAGVCEPIRSVLKKASDGFRCMAFRDGESFLREASVRFFEVVLMDIELPGISGIECTRRVKQVNPSLQVVMLTMFHEDERVFESLKAGATGYLLKSVPGKKIINAVREVRSGGSPMSPEIARKVLRSFHEPPEPNPELEALTRRQREILNCLAEGLLYKEVADRLGISPFTVRAHIHSIYEKLQVHTKVEAVNKLHGR